MARQGLDPWPMSFDHGFSWQEDGAMSPMISGYETSETLYESATSIVYRTVARPGLPATILKVLKPAASSPEDLVRYRQEYEIIQRLDHHGVIRVYDLKPFGTTLAIAVEDFDGRDLSVESRWRDLAVREILQLGAQTAQALGYLHSAGVIHRDISPSNIIWNSKSDELKIIDFGHATLLWEQAGPIALASVFEGTLAYSSPEQTGRLNRVVDYRTDLYSLGATLYELLTGAPPFASRALAELPDCHIAETPVAPHERNGEVPEALSEIVLRLMNKAPEDRYQSAFGLERDLGRCLDEQQGRAQRPHFELSHERHHDLLDVSPTHYGRERAALLDAFERTEGAAGGVSGLEEAIPRLHDSRLHYREQGAPDDAT